MLDLCRSDPATLWAATAGGLCRIRAHSIEVLGSEQGLPEGAPRRLAAAGRQAVLALYHDVLVRVDAGRVERIELPYDPART
ncbi:MAG: hypothetical protein ACE5JG_11465, partial [Planctomycetota bacterium]